MKKSQSHKSNVTRYPLLITLAILAIIGGLLVSSKNTTTTLTPQLTTSEAGFNDIVINARGTNGKEKIALFINNAPVQFWNLTNNFNDYTYTPGGEITVQELSIHFLNDTWEPENNINYDVQIPYITVNGTKYNSEHNSTVSTGSWDQDSWCAPGNKQTQWLNCNGSFTYNIPVGTVVGLPIGDPLDEATQMLTPAPGSTLTGSTVTFTWSGKEGRRYDLHVGSAPGGKDYHDRSGNYSNNSEEVTNLPVTGEKVYVKLLWTDNLWETFEDASFEYTLSAPDPNALTVTSSDVSSITSNSAEITFTATEKVRAYVEYGTSTEYGSRTSGEESFTYATHIQQITGLQADTEYYYRIHVTNQTGVTTERAGDFTTEEDFGGGEVDPVTSDLPIGGVFYGNYVSGSTTGNARINRESSRRFRAERTGFITHVSHENRTLNQANISGRCTSADPDSVWCKCENAGLDRYTCGYTLSNSYSVGNGGRIHVEVQEGNGSSESLPSGRTLATSNSYIPLEAGDGFVQLKLDRPLKLEAGKLYHLVYKNTAFPSSCKISSVNVGDAKSCPRNQGAIGLNGIWTPDLPDSYDPYRGTSAAIFTRSSTTGTWKKSENSLSWYEVKYENGDWVGDMYGAYNASSTSSSKGGSRDIGGSVKGRQNFVVEHADRKVDGVWIKFGHTGDVRPTKNLEYELKNASGNVLASGSITPSIACYDKASSGVHLGGWCREWKYSGFGKTVTLEKGSRYFIEISSDQSKGLRMSSYISLDYGGYQASNFNFWNNAQAEISTNGGSSWQGWSGIFLPQRDLPILFTIKGQPRSLP